MHLAFITGPRSDADLLARGTSTRREPRRHVIAAGAGTAAGIAVAVATGHPFAVVIAAVATTAAAFAIADLVRSARRDRFTVELDRLDVLASDTDGRARALAVLVDATRDLDVGAVLARLGRLELTYWEETVFRAGRRETDIDENTDRFLRARDPRSAALWDAIGASNRSDVKDHDIMCRMVFTSVAVLDNRNVTPDVAVAAANLIGAETAGIALYLLTHRIIEINDQLAAASDPDAAADIFATLADDWDGTVAELVDTTLRTSTIGT